MKIQDKYVTFKTKEELHSYLIYAELMGIYSIDKIETIKEEINHWKFPWTVPFKYSIGLVEKNDWKHVEAYYKLIKDL